MSKRAKTKSPLVAAAASAPANWNPRVFVNKLKREETPEQGDCRHDGRRAVHERDRCRRLLETLGVLDVTDSFLAVDREAKKPQARDLGALEAMLAAQAITLNARFTQLAHQASQMTIVDQIDRFTRLGLKAQGQCRASIETLAFIRGGPRTVFTRQANITNGPQQVNNTLTAEGSRAEILKTAPNELLEGDVEREDT